MSSNGRSERAETFDVHLGQNSLAAGMQGSPTNSEQRDVRNDVKSAETLGIKTKLQVLNPYEYFFEKRKSRLALNKKNKTQKSKDDAFFSSKDISYDEKTDEIETESSGVEAVAQETKEPINTAEVAAISLSSVGVEKKETSSSLCDESAKDNKGTSGVSPEETNQPLFGFDVRDGHVPSSEREKKETLLADHEQDSVDTQEVGEKEHKNSRDTRREETSEKNEPSPEEQELAQLQNHLLVLKNSIISSRLVIENALLSLQQMDDEMHDLSLRIEALENKRITTDIEKTK